LIQAVWRPRGRILLVLAGVALLGLAGLGVVAYLRPHYEYRAAQEALARGELPLGQDLLERCLRRWTDRADVHLQAARVARRREDFAGAERHLAACEQLQGVTRESALEWAMLHAQQGDLAGVDGQLKSLTTGQDHPDRTEILEALAKGYRSVYRHGEALTCLNQLLEKDPNYIPALLLRGRTLEKLERDEDALKDYQQAVNLAPTSFEARARLAESLAAVGQIREAIGQYEYLHQQQSDNAEVVIGLAHCRHDNSELEAARQLLDTLLAQQPDCVPALLERSRLALHLGQAAETEQRLRRAALLTPEDKDVYFVLHLCLQAQHKDTEARQCLARLRKAEADEARELNLMARIVESPHDAGLRYEIGKVFLERGQGQEALRWLMGALQEDPEHRPTHAALADYFEQTGQPGLAAQHRRWVQNTRGNSNG
jgi:tetratricopeptide (TPR) repeat protein